MAAISRQTLKFIFVNEIIRISIKISLKFVPKSPINNIPALVQATNHYVTDEAQVYWRIYTSLGLNELSNACSNTTIQIMENALPCHHEWRSIKLFMKCFALSVYVLKV